MSNVIRPNCWQRNAAYLRNGDIPPVSRPTAFTLILGLAVVGWIGIFKLALAVLP
jgi:hypothetical protein